MKREWKPGDVAIGDYPIWGTGGRDTTYEAVRLVRFASGWARADDPDDFVRDDHLTQYVDPRPLVVIDPEDREAAERLHDMYQRACADITGGSRTARYDERVDAMQAALREFADPKPPRIDEPTGRAATVEATCGCQPDKPKVFARDETAWSSDKPWQARCGSHDWAVLDAVRVLFEGVQP